MLKIMKKFFCALFLIPLMLLGFVACNTLTESGDAERIVTQFSTLRYIDGDSDRAQRVVLRVREIRAIVVDEQVPIYLLEARIRDMIPWENFDEDERFLIEELFQLIQRELNNQIELGFIEEDQRLLIDTYLGWVEDAAKMRLE